VLRCAAQLAGHTLTVTQLEWSGSGRYLLTASRDRSFCVFEWLHHPEAAQQVCTSCTSRTWLQHFRAGHLVGQAGALTNRIRRCRGGISVPGRWVLPARLCMLCLGLMCCAVLCCLCNTYVPVPGTHHHLMCLACLYSPTTHGVPCWVLPPDCHRLVGATARGIGMLRSPLWDRPLAVWQAVPQS
jgi:hypothetical protein